MEVRSPCFVQNERQILDGASRALWNETSLWIQSELSAHPASPWALSSSQAVVLLPCFMLQVPHLKMVLAISTSPVPPFFRVNEHQFLLPFSFPSSSTMKAVHREALHLAPTYCKCAWQIIPARVPCGGTFPGTGEKITERRKPLLSQSLQSPGPDESALLVSRVFYPSTQVIPDCLEQSVWRTIQLSVSTTRACQVVLVVVGVLLVVIWIECHREPVFIVLFYLIFYFILFYWESVLKWDMMYKI